MTDTQPRPPRPPRQEQEPASDEVTDVAPGVLRMQLPIWMPGLGHVNMYGLVDDRGLTVVDPGLPGPQSWRALKQRLSSAGFRLRDIHTVVVTHSHPDHFGGAGRIAREAGARLITHHAFSTWTVKGPTPQRALSEGEARRLEIEAAQYAQSVDVPEDEIPTINDPDVVHDDTEETEATSSPWGAQTPWGTTNQGPPLKRRMMIKAMRLLFSPPEPTDRVHHGERLRLADREWFVVHTPGHTVDHLCLWDPEDGTLLTGDHVLPSITPHVSGVRKADSLKSYLATLDLVARAARRAARPARARASVRRRAGPRRGDQGASRRAHGAAARTPASRSGRRPFPRSRTKCSRSGTGARWRRAKRSRTSSTSYIRATPNGGKRTACSSTAWRRLRARRDDDAHRRCRRT